MENNTDFQINELVDVEEDFEGGTSGVIGGKILEKELEEDTGKFSYLVSGVIFGGGPGESAWVCEDKVRKHVSNVKTRYLIVRKDNGTKYNTRDTFQEAVYVKENTGYPDNFKIIKVTEEEVG